MQPRPGRAQCSFHRLNWLNCVTLASAVGYFSRTRNCSLVLKVAHVTGWVSCGLIHSTSARRRIWFRPREKIKSSVIFMKGRVGQRQNANLSWESVRHTTACGAKRGIKISAITRCAKIRVKIKVTIYSIFFCWAYDHCINTCKSCTVATQ